MVQETITGTADLDKPRLFSEKGEWPTLPVLAEEQRLDIRRIRDPLEMVYLPIVLLPTVVVGGLLVYLSVAGTVAIFDDSRGRIGVYRLSMD